MIYVIFYIFNIIFYNNIYFMRLVLVVESTVMLNTRRIIMKVDSLTMIFLMIMISAQRRGELNKDRRRSWT